MNRLDEKETLEQIEQIEQIEDQLINFQKINAVFDLTYNSNHSIRQIELPPARMVLVNLFNKSFFIRPSNLSFPFVKGDYSLITFNHKNKNICFTANVINPVKPFLTKLEYPKQIAIKDRRQYFRESFKTFTIEVNFVNLPTISKQREQFYHKAFLGDISEGGISFICQFKQKVLHVGSCIIISKITGLKLNHALKAEIVSICKYFNDEVERSYRVSACFYHRQNILPFGAQDNDFFA